MVRAGVGRLGVFMLWAGVSAAPAFAQTPAVPEPAEVADAVRQNAGPRQSRRGREEVMRLDLTATMAGSQSPQSSTFLERGQIPSVDSRYYTDVQGSFKYTPPSVGQLQLGVNVQSAVRRYETSDEFMVLGHSAGGRLAYRRPRLTLTSFGSFDYLPSFSLNTTPTADFNTLAAAAIAAGELPPNAVEYSLAKKTATGTSSGIEATYALARRLTFSTSYEHRERDFHDDADPSLAQQNAGAGLSYRLTRFLGLRAGFRRRIADYLQNGEVGRTVLDDISAGLDTGYGRQVNLTRSTVLGFNSGTNLAQRNGITQADLTGNLTLGQRIGRDNQLSLAVSRGAEIREGFTEPVFSNGVAANGLFFFGRSVSAQLTATTSIGRSMQDREGGPASSYDVRGYTASARLGYQFSRHGQIYAQYVVYGHTIGDNVELLSGVLRNQANRALRGGVTFGLPLWTRIRRAPVDVPSPAEN